MNQAGDDRRPNEIAAYVCGSSLALSAVIARIASRIRAKNTFGPDDWTMFIAAVSLLAYIVLISMAIENGEGRHVLFLKSLESFMQEYVGSVICYSTTMMLTKTSKLLLYRRIFELQWLLVLSTVMIIVVNLYGLASILIVSLQCIPLSSTWTGKPGRCIKKGIGFQILGVVNVVTDVAILALPVRPVIRLNMRTRRKIQILGIFLSGAVVCVFGIIRCVVIFHTKYGDPSWNLVYSGMWSFIEVSVGIFAACLPTLAPLFKS